MLIFVIKLAILLSLKHRSLVLPLNLCDVYIISHMEANCNALVVLVVALLLRPL